MIEPGMLVEHDGETFVVTRTRGPQNGPQDYEAMKPKALVGENDRLRTAVAKARDLIGDQAGDITGAALDAWSLLETALPKRGTSRDA